MKDLHVRVTTFDANGVLTDSDVLHLSSGSVITGERLRVYDANDIADGKATEYDGYYVVCQLETE